VAEKAVKRAPIPARRGRKKKRNSRIGTSAAHKRCRAPSLNISCLRDGGSALRLARRATLLQRTSPCCISAQDLASPACHNAAGASAQRRITILPLVDLLALSTPSTSVEHTPAFCLSYTTTCTIPLWLLARRSRTRGGTALHISTYGVVCHVYTPPHCSTCARVRGLGGRSFWTDARHATTAGRACLPLPPPTSPASSTTGLVWLLHYLPPHYSPLPTTA